MARRHNAIATVVDGVRYRSKFEAAVAESLIAEGIGPHYEEEVLFYTTEHVHHTDFAPRVEGGPKVMIIEAKGYFTAKDRKKTLNVIDANPDIDYRMLFQNASNKINRASKTTYAMWCDRNNIKWAQGPEVPPEWIEELL